MNTVVLWFLVITGSNPVFFQESFSTQGKCEEVKIALASSGNKTHCFKAEVIKK